MPTPAASETLGRWIIQAQAQTGTIMQPGLGRYMSGSQVYELEVADKEMEDGGITGWAYRLDRGHKYPVGFWRIKGDGRVHTYPHGFIEVM